MNLAYTKEFVTEPIARALQRRGWGLLPTMTPCELLHSGAADIAIAPTVEYARCIGVYDYALVPGLGVMTQGFAGLISLAFNAGLQNMTTIATKLPRSSAALTAQILLSEKYDIEPTIVESPEGMTVDGMLAQADAALLVGDDAIFQTTGRQSLIDLTDEWEDVTETAYPYMLAWGRVEHIPQTVIDKLLEARDEAVLTLADYASQHPQQAEATAFYQRYLRGAVRYAVEPSDVEAIETFFRYAFYYSMIADIPAVKYLPEGAPPA